MSRVVDQIAALGRSGLDIVQAIGRAFIMLYQVFSVAMVAMVRFSLC